MRSGRTRLLWAGGFVVALVVGSLLLLPYLRTVEETRELARQARSAVTANRVVEARQLLGRWTARAPRDGEPEYYRARLDVQTDQPADALDAIRRAVTLGYPEAPLLVLRAVLLARAGQLAAAEPTLRAAFEQGAEPRVEVAEGLARIYLKNFRLVETNRVLDAWIKAAPDDPRPYLLRNEVDERSNAEPAVLIRNYREALRRDPNLLTARLGLAEKLREASLWDDAEIEYATLLERDPRNLAGLVGAGRVALLKGDLQAANRYYNAALALDPREKTALRELGVIDLNSGRYASACQRLKAAVEADPFDPAVHYSYSRALLAAGDSTRAAAEAAATDRLKQDQQRIIDLRQSLVQNPTNTDLRCQVARWLIEHGHAKEGLEWTALNLQQQPGHPATCQILVEYYTRQGELGLANYYRLEAASTTIRR